MTSAQLVLDWIREEGYYVDSDEIYFVMSGAADKFRIGRKTRAIGRICWLGFVDSKVYIADRAFGRWFYTGDLSDPKVFKKLKDIFCEWDIRYDLPNPQDLPKSFLIDEDFDRP